MSSSDEKRQPDPQFMARMAAARRNEKPKGKRSFFRGRVLGTLIAVAVILGVTYGGAGFLPGLGERGDEAVPGAFALTNEAGEAVTQKSFPGQYLLIQFGKPRPVTDGAPPAPGWLDQMGKALAELTDDERARITPIFVGVDPDRDSVNSVAAYARAVHPDIIGLTGTLDEIKRAASNYRVTVRVVPGKDGTPDAVEYNATTFLIGPEGGQLDQFGTNKTPDDLVKIIRRVLEVRGQGSVD